MPRCLLASSTDGQPAGAFLHFRTLTATQLAPCTCSSPLETHARHKQPLLNAMNVQRKKGNVCLPLLLLEEKIPWPACCAQVLACCRNALARRDSTALSIAASQSNTGGKGMPWQGCKAGGRGAGRFLGSLERPGPVSKPKAILFRQGDAR